MADLTQVRHDDAAARDVLQLFIFGGQFGSDRPPRGLRPAFVSEFLLDSVDAQSSPDVLFKTLQALRFYERADVVPRLLQGLQLPVSTREDVLRTCYVLQAAADLGVPSSATRTRLARSYDDLVARHEEVAELWAPLIDTRLVLVPSGTDDELVARLEREVARAKENELVDESGMMAYDKVAAVLHNEIPRLQQRAAIKCLVLQDVSPATRRRRLVEIYLRRLHAGVIMEEWAARQLRREAMTMNPIAVRQALVEGIERIDWERVPSDLPQMELVRAAQAVVYLGGELSDATRRLYEEARGVANFLWDDPS